MQYITTLEIDNQGHAHLINIPEPFGNVVEALSVRDVVHEHDTHSTTIVRGGDCVETLLSGSVPENKSV